MGSGLTQAYVATWGALLGEQTLSANAVQMQVSGLAPGFKYLKVILYLAGNGVSVPFQLEISDLGGTYNFVTHTITPPDVVACSAFFLAPNWRMPTLTTDTFWALVDLTISADPATPQRFEFIGHGANLDPYGNWQGSGDAVLDPTETYVQTVKIYTFVLGDEFAAGSRMQVYGLN